MQGQVLSLRPDTSLGWSQVHLESCEMPISWVLLSGMQSVLLFRLTSLSGSSCGIAPPSLWVTPQVPLTAEWDIHDCTLLLPIPSLHQWKRLWQTSSWPLGAPLRQPRREPRPPKPSICRPRRGARARWGVSCLAQYVQCCFCFAAASQIVLAVFSCPGWLCLRSVPGWVGSHLFISKSWALAFCQACRAVLYHWPFVICCFGSLSPPRTPWLLMVSLICCFLWL